MNQFKFIAFFMLVLSGILFVLFSFLVWFTKGKNKWLLSKKMRTGMHILMITGILSLPTYKSCVTPPPLCYVQVQVNAIEFDVVDEEYRILVELQKGRTIRGRIYERYADTFIFEIIDEENSVVERGHVQPVDGNFDKPYEEISIDVPTAFGPGIYRLNIMTFENEAEQSIIYSGLLHIKE